MSTRKRVAQERARERRQHEEDQYRDRVSRSSAGFSSMPNSEPHVPHHHHSSSNNNSAARRELSAIVHASSTSPPNSDTGRENSQHRPAAAGSQGHYPHYQRSPLEFHGQHVSFLPPHIIESLRPYYTKAAETTGMPLPSYMQPQEPPQQQQQGQHPMMSAVAGADRPRPPSFVFAPRYLDSGHVPEEYNVMGVAPPVDPSTLKKREPSPFMPAQHQQAQGQNGINSNNVASGTQTTFDANAPVSYVDISASNAVLQRRVERLEQQLEESIQQREKLGQVIKSMSYAIVPPLAFLPREFYEKHKQVIDTCSDYAMLYRSALRATPTVGGDIYALDAKVKELSQEHLMDRVVMLTSETMHLRRIVADLEKVQQMSP